METTTIASSVTDLGLQAHVVDQTGELRQGDVTRLTGGTISIRYVGPGLPLLTLGREIQLNLTSGVSVPFPALPATVFERREEEHSRVYRLSFEAPDEFMERLPERLRPFFRTRMAQRVRPAVDKPVHALLRDPKSTDVQKGLLLEISVEGAGLLFNEQVDEALWEMDRGVISFEPGEAQGELDSVSVFGHIRHRLLTTTGLQCGIQFENDGSAAATCARELIGAYVQKRREESAS